MPVGTSLPNQSSGLPQVSNVAPLPPNSSSVMGGDSQGMMTSSVPSGPHYQPQPIASRSQVSGMSHQMTQSPHSNNFASRPLTSKQPAQVIVRFRLCEVWHPKLFNVAIFVIGSIFKYSFSSFIFRTFYYEFSVYSFHASSFPELPVSQIRFQYMN